MKRTYQPKKVKRLRKFGFLSRKLTRGGRQIIKNQRRNGRWKIVG